MIKEFMKKSILLFISILLCIPNNILAIDDVDTGNIEIHTDLYNNSEIYNNELNEIDVEDTELDDDDDEIIIDINNKVYDYAGVLTYLEEEKLKELIDSYIDKYNMDMVLVTVKEHDKATTKDYAFDFYDYNDFGIGNTHDGVIFVIDYSFGYTDIYMATTGEAIRIYDDYRIDKILDDVAYNKNNGVYAMFEAFISTSDYYASKGVPDSNRNTYIDENGDLVVKKTIPWGLYIIISLIIPSIIVSVLLAKNKMVKKAKNATQYLDKDSIKFTLRNDKFLTTFTSRVRINTDSSGGHSGGGSSISRGSSGRSHGGGGRRL